ncbi:manganese-dependent ADP-ribose/CDP-alcohol diphosphatase isoform X1 [Astyanax mexicanus]|uniref:Manganese-dependent ADP-ribose/CDP-alcohol diphosphatase n=1 Tax=Astyanax mexicanus TaxID=7994 RepID=A0A3B1IDH5_ASTMX|nr:manganese-dependent ADP-ribose/CDP-alcohol diphosphatase isoform X1 [Astyanax mexicanus]
MTAPALMEDGAPPPLFSFGVIADIQFADKDDGFNFLRTRKRFYRNSLQILKNASRCWEEEEEPERRPAFILQLGDIIDGFNRELSASERALQTVLDEFSSCSAKVHHVWGNHEFYNFSRAALFQSALNSRDRGERGEKNSLEEVYAYHFSPHPKFRFIVLDAYDLSIIGRDKSSKKFKQSMKIITKHNHNKELNIPPGTEARFVNFSGGFSKDQLKWLDKVLARADEKQEKVAIASHLPVHPYSAGPVCLAWNYDKVLSILQSHKSVVCFMAGHDHYGGYHRDTYGVHHLTLQGVIETPPFSDAFGTVHVYEDRMVLKGRGIISDRVLMFP